MVQVDKLYPTQANNSTLILIFLEEGDKIEY